jgi:hypothetical protein
MTNRTKTTGETTLGADMNALPANTQLNVRLDAPIQPAPRIGDRLRSVTAGQMLGIGAFLVAGAAVVAFAYGAGTRVHPIVASGMAIATMLLVLRLLRRWS